MNTRTSYIVCGLSLGIVGLSMFSSGWDSKYNVELPKLVGILVAVFGVFLFAFGVLKKNIVDFENTIMKCPKCFFIASRWELKNNQCPQCKAGLEDLKGFFRRHPEHKEE